MGQNKWRQILEILKKSLIDLLAPRFSCRRICICPWQKTRSWLCVTFFATLEVVMVPTVSWIWHSMVGVFLCCCSSSSCCWKWWTWWCCYTSMCLGVKNYSRHQICSSKFQYSNRQTNSNAMLSHFGKKHGVIWGLSKKMINYSCTQFGIFPMVLWGTTLLHNPHVGSSCKFMDYRCITSNILGMFH